MDTCSCLPFMNMWTNTWICTAKCTVPEVTQERDISWDNRMNIMHSSYLVLKLMYLPKHWDKRNSPEINFQKWVIVFCNSKLISEWRKSSYHYLYVLIIFFYLVYLVHGKWWQKTNLNSLPCYHPLVAIFAWITVLKSVNV